MNTIETILVIRNNTYVIIHMCNRNNKNIFLYFWIIRNSSSEHQRSILLVRHIAKYIVCSIHYCIYISIHNVSICIMSDVLAYKHVTWQQFNINDTNVSIWAITQFKSEWVFFRAFTKHCHLKKWCIKIGIVIVFYETIYIYFINKFLK